MTWTAMGLLSIVLAKHISQPLMGCLFTVPLALLGCCKVRSASCKQDVLLLEFHET